jgi:hypothetical protein
MNRWVLAVVTWLVGATLVVTGIVAVSRNAATLALQLGLVGLAFLGFALARWPAALVPGLLLVAAPWGLALADRAEAFQAVLVGAGLVLLGELAGWALDRRTVVAEDARGALRTCARTAALVAAALAVSGLLVAVARLPAPGSLVRLVVGAMAIVLVMAFVGLRRWEAEKVRPPS